MVSCFKTIQVQRQLHQNVGAREKPTGLYPLSLIAGSQYYSTVLRQIYLQFLCDFPSPPGVPSHTICYLVSLNWQDSLASCLQRRKPPTSTFTHTKLLMALRYPSLLKNLGLAPFSRLSGRLFSSYRKAFLGQNPTDNLSAFTACPTKPTRSMYIKTPKRGRFS